MSAKMKAMYVNFIALLIVWIIMIVTGLVMWFALPGGPRHGYEAAFWGITKHTWEDIHKYAGIAFIILGGIHLILNWRWIVSTSKRLL